MRFFFIVGTPRSGTTLLQAMLLRSPMVTIPPETQFFGIMRRVKHDISTDPGWEHAKAAVIRRCEREGFKLDHDFFMKRVAEGERTYQTLLRSWLEAIGVAEGVEVVGEKSPAHAGYVPQLAEMFPEARIIHIHRDPRDVCASHREAWGRTILESAVRWRLDFSSDARDQASLPSYRYYSLSYESLVNEPAESARAISSFLDLEYIDEMADPSGRDGLGFHPKEKWKMLTTQRVTTKRIGRYRDKLSPGEIGMIQVICRSGMRQRGYTFHTIRPLSTAMIFLKDMCVALTRRMKELFSS